MHNRKPSFVRRLNEADVGILVMDFGRLFDALDLDGDGALSRGELNTAAVRL